MSRFKTSIFIRRSSNKKTTRESEGNMSTWNYEWIPRVTLKRTDSMEVLTGRRRRGVGENEMVCRERRGLFRDNESSPKVTNCVNTI
jgi:hypothetical protein